LLIGSRASDGRISSHGHLLRTGRPYPKWGDITERRGALAHLIEAPKGLGLSPMESCGSDIIMAIDSLEAPKEDRMSRCKERRKA
jgi:hypothetical protein